ncbi:hypothetical protein CCR75_001365 [Bremia lactucae]|uniref:Rab-GAP TBC domain-containing protein n=1 Tax=Bremia lactucae TaxID=4779 RepID=A0A976IBD8_BRELC|nr:hypothetical protein CCR75_001365 [Bremia lactucae]
MTRKSRKGVTSHTQMLQGLRRKMGRYAPRGGMKDTINEGDQQALKVDASSMEVAMWHFTSQDRALKRLETHLMQMLDQIQVACATMATVADIFSQACSKDEDSCGEEYKAAMKQIEVQEAERIEQSIRFMVLDPLQARLERHGQLKQQLIAWHKLTAEYQLLHAEMQKMRSSGLVDHDKRIQLEKELHRVASVVQVAEATFLPQLEDANRVTARCLMDLFSTTRLQTALFFRNANQTALSSLSLQEKEIVAEANSPLKFSSIGRLLSPCVPLSSSSTKWNQSSSLASDTENDGSISSTALDGIETIFGSDEDDENTDLITTREEFETRKGLWKRKEQLAVVEMDENEYEDEDLKPRCSTFVSTSLKQLTSNRRTSVFSTLRKTIRGTLGYAIKETRVFRQSSALTTAMSRMEHQRAATFQGMNTERWSVLKKAPYDWVSIEDCLWEIDARRAPSCRKSLLLVDSISSNTTDLLYQLVLKKESLYFECLSYLRVEDLARLSKVLHSESQKVNFRLHSHLVDNAPIWKKCIRSGGLLPSIRSSLWLAVFYEATPWQSKVMASPYLSATRRSRIYDELLRTVESKAFNGFHGVDHDTQWAVWFQEIDVDVVRTCHRNTEMHSTNKSNTASLCQSLVEDDKDIHDSVTSILNGIMDTIVECQGSVSTTHSMPLVKSRTRSRSFELEAKMRRVLRAYVVYNPRVGYCQGMSFLVRFLADVAINEADLFWLFVGFADPTKDANLYEPGMAVLQPNLLTFQTLFSTHMPELFAHLESEGVHVAMFCTRWFLTFFSAFETLVPTLVTRVLEIFIIDGWRIIFSVSLVILNELQHELLRCDMEGILRVLKSPRCHMPEPDELCQQQLLRHALAYSISPAINLI